MRQYCTSGASTIPMSVTTVASDVKPSQSPPTISVTSGYAGSPSTGCGYDGRRNGHKVLDLRASKPVLVQSGRVPTDSAFSGSLSGVGTPLTTTGCSFATPGTGTYASTLCFVDFTPFNYALYNVNPNPANSPLSTPPSSCQQMTAAVTGTPYVLSFCMSTSSSGTASAGMPGSPGPGAVVPYPIPTYFDPPVSESYLGNNGVYTGIQGEPALYQNSDNGGVTSYVYFSNIKLLDSNGNAATSWELVTGDAESTDQGESIAWTSNQPLSLLPNSPASPYGNACAGSSSPAGLTGLGTTTVQCGASVNSNKTGTIMLEAAAPTTLTVTLVGAGLEATFLGVLLP